MNKEELLLKDRYCKLSDQELSELYDSGNLTSIAKETLLTELNNRGLSLDKVNEVLNNSADDRDLIYLNSSPLPLPKIWIGFLIAGIAFLAEFYDVLAGYTRIGIRTPILMIGCGYWLFCVDRFHRILNHISAGTYKISSRTAAVFHFIPIFNIYWIIRWPIEFADFLSKNGRGRILSGWILGILFLIFIVLGRAFDGPIGLFCIFLLFLYMSSKLGKCVELFESRKKQSGPKCFEDTPDSWF